MSGIKLKSKKSKGKTVMQNLKLLSFKLNFYLLSFTFLVNCFASEIKEPNVAGAFYPADPDELSGMIEAFLDKAAPETVKDDIIALIVPHAGYVYSGQTAAFGYKLIQGKDYKTVVVISPAHHYAFSGVSVYPEGFFRTPLGDIEIDRDFTQELLSKDPQIIFEPAAFEKEHALEVQLPFLQKALSNFKIVPVVMGDCSLETCKKFARLLKETVGRRKDVLFIASSDMYHGYDFQEAGVIDELTNSYLRNMDAEGLYSGLREGKLQLCGGFPAVTVLMASQELGYNRTVFLDYTNSALVTGKKTKGNWTVGYSSWAITGRQKGEGEMLTKEQRKKLLELARKSIEAYLNTGKKLELSEKDPMLVRPSGAFVTLHKNGDLRGCIGSLVGTQPLYLTIRDMAVEAAVGDPRFTAVTAAEFKNIEIEISALSPLQRVFSADTIKLGTHGVLVRRGSNTGVFLPQVATETGWSKEEFLSNLCSHKAGLSPDAWKDETTELYVFTAEVFSEKSY